MRDQYVRNGEIEQAGAEKKRPEKGALPTALSFVDPATVAIRKAAERKQGE